MAAEKRILKWGICGSGFISQDFARAMKTLPRYGKEFELEAIGARSIESAKKFADLLQIPKAYGSYQDLANDSNIDIVYVGVINTEHVRLTMMMLEAGKHVICEKPFAETWEKCKAVFEFAKKKNLVFMEAVWSRFFPVYKAIKEEIASGNIGEVNMVTAQFCIPIIGVERIRQKNLLGGCLLDIGIYCIQFACHVYGEMPEKIIATGSLTEEGVDEDGCVIMLYSGNRKANITYSGKTPGGSNCATIMGAKGKIFIEEPFWSPKKVTLTKGTVENEIPDGPYNFVNSGGLRYEADHMYDLVKDGKLDSPIYGYKECEMIHKIMDEIISQIGLKF